jgi:hypothetical protein
MLELRKGIRPIDGMRYRSATIPERVLGGMRNMKHSSLSLHELALPPDKQKWYWLVSRSRTRAPVRYLLSALPPLPFIPSLL